MNQTTDDQRMLARVEDLLRNMPPVDTFIHPPDNAHGVDPSVAWLGRAAAVLRQWDSSGSVWTDVRAAQDDLLEAPPGAFTRRNGIRRLVMMLHQAQQDLTIKIGGPTNLVVQAGMVFDYFEGIRRLIEFAAIDLFFVDPYLDADFVARYLPAVRDGVTIRLLAREKLPTLLPAIDQYGAQSGCAVQVRSVVGFHDRYVFIDRSNCHQSGASFKDGAKNSPTTLTEISDACAEVLALYEGLWTRARVER